MRLQDLRQIDRSRRHPSMTMNAKPFARFCQTLVHQQSQLLRENQLLKKGFQLYRLLHGDTLLGQKEHNVMLTNTLTLEEIEDGYISQYCLDTLMNRYFSRTDISDNVHPSPFYTTIIKQQKYLCIYSFMKILKRQMQS